MAISSAPTNNISELIKQKRIQEGPQPNHLREEVGGPTFPPAPPTAVDLESKALEPSEGVEIKPEEMDQFRNPLTKDFPGYVGDQAKQVGSNAFNMLSDATKRATNLARQVADGATDLAEQAPEMAQQADEFLKDEYPGLKLQAEQAGAKLGPEGVEYDDSNEQLKFNAELDMLYSYLSETRPDIKKSYPDLETFKANLPDFGFDDPQSIKNALARFGLEYGPGGEVMTASDMDMVGDVAPVEGPIQANPRDAKNKAYQDQREREGGEVSLESVPHAFTQHKGTQITGGPLSYDPSLPGPRRRTGGGAAFDAIMAELPNLYQNPAANQEKINEYSNYIANQIKLDPLQFPEEQRQAMVNSEVLGHISRFGDSKTRSITKMLAEGNNPWFEKGTDQNGNPIYEAAIPNDGRDGVAPNSGRVAVNQFNPNTGNYEVVRAPERRIEDNRRAAHTMLHEQLETGNFDTSRYLDENGNWLMTEDVNGMGQFMIDHADALGIKLDFDEAGNVIMQENGLPSFSDYVGRGAGINKSAGLQKELGVFLNRMQRNDNFAQQRAMRGHTQNMQSPTLGPRMYANSMRNAKDDRERAEIAREYGDDRTGYIMESRIHDQALVDAAEKGAKQVDPSLAEESRAAALNFSNAVANGNPAEALQHLSVIGVEGAPANQRLATAKLAELRQAGAPINGETINANMQFFSGFLNDMADKVTLYAKDEQGMGGQSWGPLPSIQGMRNQFVNDVTNGLGISRDELGVKEALWSYFDAHHGVKNSRAGEEYEDGIMDAIDNSGVSQDFQKMVDTGLGMAAPLVKQGLDALKKGFSASGKAPEEQKGTNETRAKEQAEKAVKKQKSKK